MKIHSRLKLLASAILLLFLTFHSAISETSNLHLVKAIPIDAPANLNPSGLTYCNGDILLVSDKIDNTVYKVNILEHSATLDPAVTLHSIPKHSSGDHTWKEKAIIFLKSLLTDSLYDWEGITCAPDGNFLLLSETYADVAMVSKSGVVTWLNTDLLRIGKQYGLFQINNAYTEGIVSLDDKRLIIAAERQPRGLVVLDRSRGTWETKIYSPETSPTPPKQGRASDFSGLTVHNNMLYSLERNASAVCARNISNLKPVQCWSYAHVEEANDFRYQDDTYGLAEGIAFTDEYLLIVLDNNGDARFNDPEDHRAELVIFQKPGPPEN